MESKFLAILGLWTVVTGIAQGCPEPCNCMDRFSVQLADCAAKDLLLVPVGLPSNVTTLSLSANKIQVLKTKSFVNVTMITSLWLGHNAIVTVEQDTLAPLVNLRNLDISYNKIINFPWEDLVNLTALKLLKMNNNEMVYLPKDAFLTLKELRSLRINNNKFTTITQGTFESLSLSHLQIYNNPFTCSCNLEWLRDWIKEVKISVPEQGSIACELPAHLKGVSVVKMPKMDCKSPTVTITHQSIIKNMVSTTVATTVGKIRTAQGCPEPCNCMDRFSVQLADCAYKDLLHVPVGLPSNVTTLSLSANKIQVLKAKSFVNVTMITSLWLGHNAIVTVEQDTLAPLVNLRNLDISHNKIINFPWEDLVNLTALQLLKMNNNEMVYLPKDAFLTLKELRSLRINNNKFTTITQGTFESLSLSHLQIYNNPFTCSCNLEWLRDWIMEVKISVPEQETIACEFPAHLKGVSVVKMPKMDCKAPTVTIINQPNVKNSELYE